MSPSTPQSAVSVEAHALSTAQRLLGGTGMASLVAYRIDSARAINVLSHGLTNNGDLVVAVLREEAPGLGGSGVEVRFDIQRESAEPQVRILASTIHLLGRVTWLTPDDAGVADLDLPEPVEWALEATDSVLGVMRQTDRVLVHDGSGVVPMSFADVAAVAEPRFPTRLEEMDAHDVVRSLPTSDLLNIHKSVTDERISGRILSVKPTPDGMPHRYDQIYCVDVDSFGIQLMLVEAECTTVSFAAFSHPANDVDELSWRTLEVLLQARP